MTTSSYSVLKPDLAEDMYGNLDKKSILTLPISTVTPAINVVILSI